MIRPFHFCLTIILAFMAGILSRDIYVSQTAKMKTAHAVGTCLSNGLFYEKITGIRYSAVLSNAIYELSPTIQGKLGAPDTTDAWIVDDIYVVVANSNCLD